MESSRKVRKRTPSRRALEAMDVDVDEYLNLTSTEPPSASPSTQPVGPSYPFPDPSTPSIKRRKKHNPDISTPVSILPLPGSQPINSPKKRKRKDSDTGGSPLAVKRVAKSGGRKNVVADDNAEAEPSIAASVGKKTRKKQFIRLETLDEPLPPLGPLSPLPRQVQPMADLLSGPSEPPPDHLPRWWIAFTANKEAPSTLCAYRCGGNVESDLISDLSCDPSSPDILLPNSRQSECNLGFLFNCFRYPNWKYAVYSLYPSIPADPLTAPVVDPPSSSSDRMGASSSSSNPLPFSLSTPGYFTLPQLDTSPLPSACILQSTSSPAPLDSAYLISSSTFARCRPHLPPALLDTFFSLDPASNASHYMIALANE